jgi:hypothetical protein
MLDILGKPALYLVPLCCTDAAQRIGPGKYSTLVASRQHQQSRYDGRFGFKVHCAVGHQRSTASRKPARHPIQKIRPERQTLGLRNGGDDRRFLVQNLSRGPGPASRRISSHAHTRSSARKATTPSSTKTEQSSAGYVSRKACLPDHRHGFGATIARRINRVTMDSL